MSDDPPPFAEADRLLLQPTTCLGASLPGLWLARDEPIPTADLPVRVATALARLGAARWGDVLDQTPADLLETCGFGEGSLRPFLAVAAGVATTAAARGPLPIRLPTPTAFLPSVPARPPAGPPLARRLVQWAAAEAGAGTVADLLAALAAGRPPADIAAVLAARLDDFLPGAGRAAPLGVLADDLYGVLAPRSQVIFGGRIALDRPRTLDDLGVEFGITRERVRQIEGKAEGRVRAAVDTPRFAPVAWRAHALATHLGTAAPDGSDHLAATVGHVTRDVPEADRGRARDLLLWLAGPYTRDAGWLRSADPPGSDLADAHTDPDGRVDVARVRDGLAAAGLRPPVHPAWLDGVGRVRQVGGHWLRWTGTVTDKAVRLLAAWGEPATPDVLVAAIGGGHDVKATRARLYEDDRVVRAGVSRVGLRAWRLAEYSTTADEIGRELDGRGGAALLDEVVAAVTARFDLREASVRLSATTPLFVLDGPTLRRRTPADPPPVVPLVTAAAGCYLLGPDVLAWRVEVTADILRGSGRQLPAAVAGWLGLAPGGRRTLTTAGGPVGMSWPAASVTGPSAGSLRAVAERAGAGVGDHLLLTVRRDADTLDAARLDPAAVAAATGLRRLALLTGVTDGDGDAAFLQPLGRAVGGDGTPAGVRDALTRRGEAALAALVPADADPSAAVPAVVRTLF